jgi:hypothetical protein
MLTGIFKRNVSVIRKGEGAYIDHVWQDGIESDFVIRASVHPTPARVLETLPEGYRTSDSFTLYTTTRLISAEDNINNPDTVILYDNQYLVAQIKRWDNSVLSHFETVVTKDERDVN